MRNFIFLIAFLSAITLFATNEKAGTSGFAFFKVKMSPRAAALANAYTGMSDDIEAVFYNPAGLFQINEKQVMANYTNYFADFNGGSVAYVFPLNDKITLGVFSQFLSSGSMERTSIGTNGEVEYDGEFGANELIFGTSGSYYVSDIIKAGGNLKLLSENIDGKSASALAIDLGIHHQTTNEKITVGVVVRNLGIQLSKFEKEGADIDLPITTTVGFNYKAFDNLDLCLDIYKPLDLEISGNLGVEWRIHPLISLRSGYKSNADDWRSGGNLDFLSGFSAGVGFSKRKFNIDYAFSAFGELGYLNQIAVKYNFK